MSTEFNIGPVTAGRDAHIGDQPEPLFSQARQAYVQAQSKLRAYYQVLSQATLDYEEWLDEHPEAESRQVHQAYRRTHVHADRLRQDFIEAFHEADYRLSRHFGVNHL